MGPGMPSKKKAAKSKPSKKPAAKKAAPKPAKRAPKKVARSAPKKAAKARAPTAPARKAGGSDVASRMAAFSSQVLKEEEAPVAVRSFNEARAGLDKTKELNVKTGEAKPAMPPPSPQPSIDIEAEVDADEEEIDVDKELEEETRGMTTSKPLMEPLTGPAAVPKRREVEDFKFTPPPPKGKKGQLPTKEDLGRIELRMQRATKDEKIADVNPDYLQRSFNKAAEKGKVAATTGERADSDAKDEEFEVEMDKGEGHFDKSLAEFGDVEIAQQTRKGSRKVGKLDTDKDD